MAINSSFPFTKRFFSTCGIRVGLWVVLISKMQWKCIVRFQMLGVERTGSFQSHPLGKLLWSCYINNPFSSYQRITDHIKQNYFSWVPLNLLSNYQLIDNHKHKTSKPMLEYLATVQSEADYGLMSDLRQGCRRNAHLNPSQTADIQDYEQINWLFKATGSCGNLLYRKRWLVNLQDI